MSNLLPVKGKKIVRREYWIRVVSVWFFLAAAALVLAAGFMLPSYIYTYTQLNALQPDVAAVEHTDTAAYTEAVATVERANEIATRLRRVEQGITAAEAMTEARGEVIAGITLSGITFSKENPEAIELEVRGVAATREALTDFVSALRRNPYFLDASVPVENLAEGVNASFVVTVTVNQES